MTILVTGAGLIGSTIAKKLATDGEKVIVMDIRQPDDLPSDITFVAADITDADAIEQIISAHNIKRIIHTAAMLSTAMRANPVKGLNVNILGTVNLLEACRSHNIQRIVLVSSTTVLYSGFSTLGPEPISEDSPLTLISQRPASLYAISKLTTEQIALLYREMYGLNTISLRFGAVIGGKTDVPSSVPGRLFSKLVAAAKSQQTITLDDPLLIWKGKEEFIDVRDCADAAICALNAEHAKLGIYNIVHPKQWSLDEVITAIADLHGAYTVHYDRDLNTGFAGFPHIRPAASSIAAAHQELNFTPRYDLLNSLAYWW